MAPAQNKTEQTKSSVKTFLRSVDNAKRRGECVALIR
jgi:hypothetical protein